MELFIEDAGVVLDMLCADVNPAVTASSGIVMYSPYPGEKLGVSFVATLVAWKKKKNQCSIKNFG